MTKEIKLKNGVIALVDDDDYEELNRYNWLIEKQGANMYARRSVYIGDNKRNTIRMHRQILGLEYGDDKEIDHINRNGLDNRRANLRIVCRATNVHNSKMNRGNTSGHKGVGCSKSNKKWCARIGAGGKTVYLGVFDNIEDAVNARKRGEITYWWKDRHRKYTNVPNSPI